MNTNITLTAEQIAQACESYTGDRNRQAIEDAFDRQTPPEILIAAVARADAWPTNRMSLNAKTEKAAEHYGLQYAYLIEFLICDEVRRNKLHE